MLRAAARNCCWSERETLCVGIPSSRTVTNRRCGTRRGAGADPARGPPRPRTDARESGRHGAAMTWRDEVRACPYALASQGCSQEHRCTPDGHSDAERGGSTLPPMAWRTRRRLGTQLLATTGGSRACRGRALEHLRNACALNLRCASDPAPGASPHRAGDRAAAECPCGGTLGAHRTRRRDPENMRLHAHCALSIPTIRAARRAPAGTPRCSPIRTSAQRVGASRGRVASEHSDGGMRRARSVRATHG